MWTNLLQRLYIDLLIPAKPPKLGNTQRPCTETSTEDLKLTFIYSCAFLSIISNKVMNNFANASKEYHISKASPSTLKSPISLFKNST